MKNYRSFRDYKNDKDVLMDKVFTWKGVKSRGHSQCCSAKVFRNSNIGKIVVCTIYSEIYRKK